MERRTIDIEEMTLNDSKILRRSFEKMDISKEFRTFDYYLIEKWKDNPGSVDFNTLDIKETEDLRKEACSNFRKALKGNDIANPKTIRRWFGINGFTLPKRDIFFKVAITLQLSVEETEDYMVNGMMIPSFQINDYREIIYLFGLHNHLEYDYCMKMIELFEEKMGCDIEYKQEPHTQKLWEEYEVNKGLEPIKFVKWMLKNKNMFKGYSKTVLDYFILLKEEVSGYIKKEESDYLEHILATNGYEKWLEENNNNYNDDIAKQHAAFIRHLSRSKKDKIEKHTLDSLRKAYNAVYRETSDSEFIREMYPIRKADLNNVKFKEKIDGLKESGISFMSNKYLSQILSIADQKANYMRIRNVRAQLQNNNEKEKCLEELKGIIANICGKTVNDSVKEALKITEEYLMNQQQRCQLIGRDDILPLVHYISQKRYSTMIKEEKRVYNMEEAASFFRNIADAILAKCGMALISTGYKSDYYMLASFSKEDMYSLVDMLEISVQI